VSHQITKDQLLPGDVLLDTSQHVVIFGGWTDSSHTTYTGYEEVGPDAWCALEHTIPYPYQAGYTGFVPYRYNNIEDWTGSSCDDQLTSVSFPDSVHGWAVGTVNGSGAGIIERTINGGANWTYQTEPEPLTAVSFPDSSHGWAVGDGGTILAMTAGKNGTTSWAPQAWDMSRQGVAPSSVVLTGVHFADDYHGWAVGLEWVAYDWEEALEYLVIIKTDDGGKTWTQEEPADLGNVGVQTASIDCIDGEHAWVVLNGVVISTVDGGSTWRYGASPVSDYGYTYGLNSAHFENSSHGWVVGWIQSGPGAVEKGAIFVTDDGGLTWSIQADDLAVSQLRSISFSDAQNGVAVGYSRAVDSGSSSLWATSDGGAHWTAQQSPNPDTDSYLESVSSPDADHACAVGSGQLFFYGPDSGGPAGSSQQPYRPIVDSKVVQPTIVLIGGLLSNYGDNGDAEGQTWHGVAQDLRLRGYTVLVPPMQCGTLTSPVQSADVMDSMGDISENVSRLDTWLAEQEGS